MKNINLNFEEITLAELSAIDGGLVIPAAVSVGLAVIGLVGALAALYDFGYNQVDRAYARQ